jgi:hypothetical protein
MSATTQLDHRRVLVIPRPLEGFFYHRLVERYSGREDIEVIVERRVGDRRCGRPSVDRGVVGERRTGERRGHQVVWSLADMPFAAS